MSLFKNSKNSKKQGDVGLAFALAWFAKNDYTVCIPLTDSQDYDVVVEINEELKRVQVRTTTQIAPSGNFTVDLRVSGGNRSGTGIRKQNYDMKYDLLFVVTDTGEQYLVPKCDFSQLARNLTLNESMQKYKVT